MFHMRRWARQFGLLGLLLVSSLTLLPAASAGTNFGLKVDAGLVDKLNALASTDAKVHVLVFGGNLAAVNAAIGVAPRNTLDEQGAESLAATSAQIAQLAAATDVQYVTFDRPLTPTDDPTVPAATDPAPTAPTDPVAPAAAPTPAATVDPLQTLYPQVDGALGAWAAGNRGAGVGIAVVDSGAVKRKDFGDRLVQVTLPTQDGTKIDDSVGHGSAVAGVAAGASPDGRYVGIAPGATIYAINVSRDDGVFTSDVLAGLTWVLHHAREDNIRVVNLSLTQLAPSDYTSSTLDAAVELLWKSGVVVVVSSGNLGGGSELYAPANDPFVITVGASDTADTAATADDSLASFSSYGPTSSGYAKPEIVAPGRHIVTTIPGGSALAKMAPAANIVDPSVEGYIRINGTSFSAPQVTGAVALLLEKYPSLTPDQVKWVLTHNERPVSGSDAGALDIGAQFPAAAAPGVANQSLQYSTWARPGALTAAFGGGIAGAARAAAWDQSAVVWESNAVTRCAKAATADTAAKFKTAYVAAWSSCAGAWERAAAAWDESSAVWGGLNLSASAATDARSAGKDWSSARDGWLKAAAWDKASNGYAAAAWDRAAAAWDRAAAWDAAVSRAAAWDVAAWDRAAAWDAAAWDLAAAWD